MLYWAQLWLGPPVTVLPLAKRGPVVKRRAFVSWGAGAAVAVLAASLIYAGNAGSERNALSAGTPAATASALSCKVVTPVRVTLQPSAMPDVWRVHVEALETTPAVTVTLGMRAGERELGRTLVWSGALAAGTSRDFEARLAPGADATRVWVEADAAGTPGGTLRSLSGLDLQQGKVMANAVAAAGPGRLVKNPQTGETVLEFDGATGGAR
jgi:hypothetical protein